MDAYAINPSFFLQVDAAVGLQFLLNINYTYILTLCTKMRTLSLCVKGESKKKIYQTTVVA